MGAQPGWQAASAFEASLPPSVASAFGASPPPSVLGASVEVSAAVSVASGRPASTSGEVASKAPSPPSAFGIQALQAWLVSGACVPRPHREQAGGTHAATQK